MHLRLSWLSIAWAAHIDARHSVCVALLALVYVYVVGVMGGGDMTFQLQATEKIRVGVRRIALEQIEKALLDVSIVIAQRVYAEPSELAAERVHAVWKTWRPEKA
ncbi:hypothetical protein FHS27_000132 [Rhodopirellula rubra]|uniref:Uncharacterized protein n=1 Tax=Aporhodopirellula rubra TaxID=980271 RepID=A0A7W5H3R3_9BACT|nr:hypothetical protein [Aporhodopirellula rubra]MBB3204368.1 hypothetical protein [Aporhodopirellula rubra]